MSMSDVHYNVDLDYEIIRLPMVTDILVVGKKVPQGKNGILLSFQLIAPDVFELLEIDESETVEAVIINKTILRKLPAERVLQILREHVFPHVSRGETLKVNFNVQIFHDSIKGGVYEGVCSN
ncbi:MAG: hypothetical protein KKA67_06720 [Spirochaetes bacterium]|nr:hypothetical protein [Spirochaetota bacterium]MBU1080326.1 hypothetical protein [Spirochaetota bacterium]